MLVGTCLFSSLSTAKSSASNQYVELAQLILLSVSRYPPQLGSIAKAEARKVIAASSFLGGKNYAVAVKGGNDRKYISL